MGVFDNLKNINLPEELFHYTSQGGLLGIFSSDSLWTTNISHLNDSQEFQLALNQTRELLLERRKSNSTEQEKIDCLLHNIETIRDMYVFVGSLSQKRDLLSQWRAYGGGVSGFSIGFNTDNLVAKAEEQGFFLVKCIYDPKEQKHFISELINESLAEDFNVIPGYISPDMPRTYHVLPIGGDFWKKLASLAPIIKHQSFEEEAEWRLISVKFLNKEAMSFRSGLSSLIPYYEFKLGDKTNYLNSVTIGPTPNPILAKKSIQMLLTKYDLTRATDLYNTEIPFRNW